MTPPVLEREPEKEPDTIAASFRVKKALLKEIDAAAKAMGLSRNKAINQLLKFALDAHHREAKRPKK